MHNEAISLYLFIIPVLITLFSLVASNDLFRNNGSVFLGGITLHLGIFATIHIANISNESKKFLKFTLIPIPIVVTLIQIIFFSEVNYRKNEKQNIGIGMSEIEIIADSSIKKIERKWNESHCSDITNSKIEEEVKKSKDSTIKAEVQRYNPTNINEIVIKVDSIVLSQNIVEKIAKNEELKILIKNEINEIIPLGIEEKTQRIIKLFISFRELFDDVRIVEESQNNISKNLKSFIHTINREKIINCLSKIDFQDEKITTIYYRTN